MPLAAWIVLALLVTMFTLLIVTSLPAWVIFLGTLTVAMTLRLAPADALLNGFSNVGVLTVAALFVVAAGMYRTGAVTLIADRLIGRPRSVGQSLRRVVVPIAAASAFLNNTPLVAMMIPVIRDLGRTNAKVPASKLYMPVSIASILGGAVTLIGTSSNLIVAGLVTAQIDTGQAHGLRAIGIFTPLVVGLPAAVVGLAFVLFFANRLLPDHVPDTERHDPTRRFLAQFVVDPHGPLVGRGLSQSGLDAFAGSELISHQSAGECPWLTAPEDDGAEAPADEGATVRHVLSRVVDVAEEALTPSLSVFKPEPPEGDAILTAGDVLTFSGTLDAILELWATIGLRAAIAPVKMKHEPHTHRLVEVVMDDTSEAVGHHVVHLPIEYRNSFHSKVVAVAVDDDRAKQHLSDMRVRAGDTLLLEVTPSFLYDARNEADFALVRRLHGFKIKRTSRAAVAAAIVVVMVLLATFGVTSMLNAALLAGLALFATGCLSFSTAMQSIEFDTVIVLGAAVGLEAAVTGSGLAAAAADLLVTLAGSSPYLAVAVLFIGVVIATNVINAAAAAVLLFPVAVGMAAGMEVSAMPFVMALMLGASYSFVNPAGFQTNLMVQKPGGYTFADFAKVGLPLSVLVSIVVIVLVPIFFPF